ncbi:hypothetical protein HHI36_018461 [Cryptolaemus montrouzieri]|uniref:Galactokinase n=1 Tax=Cryptolaemus montrouzieri TaxID=559131 RepID=A0ABD2P0D3_9CUCU
MESSIVPILEYPKGDTRIIELRQFFQENFQVYPDFLIRVPGRVNLIGEHIDYCGYGVCPMAIDQDILLAISKVDSEEITLVNANDKYKKQILGKEFSGCTIPEWHHYFLCGVRGVQDTISGDVKLKGMNVAVNGNIPPSAGLSSSSALVSSAALCTFYANGVSEFIF